MADLSGRGPQACLLVYDGKCRLCVTAQQGLDRLGTRADTAPVRMVPYQSDEAKQALGEAYRPYRPDAAFLVRPNGEIARGSTPFWPFCLASGVGEFFLFFCACRWSS